MVAKVRRRGWLEAPIHPPLVAAFPVLFLFAQNVVQQVTLDPLWRPLVIAVVAAIGLWALGTALLHDRHRGALAATLLIVLFFSFGHVYNIAHEAFSIESRRPLAIAYAVVAVVALALVWQGGRWVVPGTRYLNMAAVILVVFNIVRIGGFVVDERGGDVAITPSTAPASPSPGGETLRDIYYLVLDRYGNEETLRTVYGYNNRPFLDELGRRGFTVSPDSWANYFKTAFSLVSSLSMEHLDGAALKDGDPPTYEPLHALLRGHLAVPVALKQLGYRYVHIANVWEPTATNVDADVVLRYAGGSQFEAALLGSTAWMLTMPPSSVEDDSEGPYRELSREHTLFQFEQLRALAGRPGPKFVFAHILIPHGPWRFRADGSFPDDDEVATTARKGWYLDHVAWANAQVLEVLDRVVGSPRGKEPIVILQADEGEYPDAFARNQSVFDWLSASQTDLQHKFGILNALYLPGVDAAAAGVHDRLSPVNNFRVVFNAYFDRSMPMRPDTTFLSPNIAHMYDFVPYERP